MTAPRRRRILVIEDEAQVATLLRRGLEAIGYDVEITATGDLGLAEAQAHQPDLVILDLRLPDRSGYEVCKALRQLYHSWIVPVVMLTGLDRPIDQLRGYAHGADAYVTKPFQFEELREVITLLLGETAATT